MKNLIIIGAGGVGRETAWIVEQINIKNKTYKILGFIDDNSTIWNTYINGYKVLGGIDYLIDYKDDVKVVVAIANYKVKKNIVGKLKNKRISYTNIIHPSLNIHKSVQIGEGNIIYEGAIISPNVSIGNHIIISPKSGIGHDSIIKDYVSLLWNVSVSGNDLIEEGVLLGSASTIIQGKRIGKGSIVGAGSVVINNIDDKKTVVGIPAKVIK
ncbi:transferase [Clostridium perfringens]|uniref:acetyltransferase n=1 Tax=Clostridium perfringens TaxID=1502 RepID=UPI000D70E6B3|nr:acetyltransferase [Clostridium perfringens]PWX19591.1 transferase [Clostridium perfringens]